jgi:hypothetical protein
VFNEALEGEMVIPIFIGIQISVSGEKYGAHHVAYLKSTEAVK